MPHDISLISTIAAGLSLALVMGYVATRIGVPPLVGYLVAGIIAGPATPGFVADVHLTSQLAELGVMLMMFGVGLHFSLEDLIAVRRIAVPGAMVQIIGATVSGAALAHWWGWSWSAGLVFGLSLSVASTVVLLRALEARGLLQSPNGRIAVGWLVVEDLVVVLILVLLPAFAGAGQRAGHPLAGGSAAGQDNVLLEVAVTFGKVAAFVALMLIVGKRLLPRLLWGVARTGSRELFTLAVISAAVGVAYASAELFSVSFALGAFFAGMMLRESALSHRAAEESLPLRDAFSVLFFVSVGMLFEPAIVLREPLKLLALLGIIMVGKTIAALALVLAFRYPLNTALTVGASLAQIGEFSFILAGLGIGLGLLPPEAQSLIVAGALLSISFNSLVFAAIEPLQRWVRRRSTFARQLDRRDDPLAELPATVDVETLTGHVVLVGYGRVGSRIAKAMSQKGVRYVVVEMNRESVERLREHGIHAVSGDASEAEVLVQAHVARASVLVVATPDPVKIRKIVDIARTLNPNIDCLLRTHSDEEAEFLRQKNLGQVFMGEHELATAMTDYVLSRTASPVSPGHTGSTLPVQRPARG